MFDLKGSKEIYNKGNIKQIIIDKDSITISFEEGYEDKDGNFVPVGSDHIILTEEEKNNLLSVITIENSTESFVQKIRNVEPVMEEDIITEGELLEEMQEPIE